MARGESDGLVEVSPKATLTIAHVFVTVCMTALPITFILGAYNSSWLFGQGQGQNFDASKIEHRLDDIERSLRNKDRDIEDLERRVDNIRQCNCRGNIGHPIGSPVGSPAGASPTVPSGK